jgi:hypothetical protein
MYKPVLFIILIMLVTSKSSAQFEDCWNDFNCYYEVKERIEEERRAEAELREERFRQQKLQLEEQQLQEVQNQSEILEQQIEEEQYGPGMAPVEQ